MASRKRGIGVIGKARAENPPPPGTAVPHEYHWNALKWHMQPVVVVQLLILLTLANGTPVIAKKLFGGRLSYPLDGGATFVDGRPWFGPSKTIRGILLSILVTSAGATLMGLSWKTGAGVGSLAMAGDLFSSFLKRRMNLPAGGRATGLDQIPESLFPVMACWNALSLTAMDVVATVGIFFAGEIALSRLLFKLHVRDRPY